MDAALLSSHHREHEMLDHEHEMQLHHLAPATDRMKRRSALLSSRPKALHLVPGAEGHPLLASDPLPPSTRSESEEPEQSAVTPREGRRDSAGAGGLDAGLVAIKFVSRMRGGKRLLRRRPAVDAADIRDVAREATRSWFTSVCDAALQQRGEEDVDREKVMADVRRRGSIEMAEAFFFLAGLSPEAREHWSKLCGLGVISPWDPVTRQTRYLLKARKAAEDNLREQEARDHDAHFGRSHEHAAKPTSELADAQIGKCATSAPKKRAVPSPPVAAAKPAIAGPRRVLRTPHEGHEGGWPRKSW